ncbi:enhancer of split mdelta protein isoform X2 [Bemisia tabaci]|uniref:enhancer of split mdelta protein isoform X2 n=1 Tax=Bemisia tabaci TaxID=7038 RepID=UPI003B27DF1E
MKNQRITKPMLERRRRARINRCLDELKELMVKTLQDKGENVSKLEKADILELTVNYLYTLQSQHALALTPEAAYADRFRAGFTHCAAEVSQYLAAAMNPSPSPNPDASPLDQSSGVKLLKHLGTCIRTLSAEQMSPEKDEGSSVWRPW